MPDNIRDLRRFAVDVFDQRVVDGALDLFFGNRQPDTAVTLRVHVHQQRFLPETGQASCQIDAGGRLPASTLLIDDRDRPHVKPSLVSPDKNAADPSAEGLRKIEAFTLNRLSSHDPNTRIGTEWYRTLVLWDK